jgi:hypothetical protein
VELEITFTSDQFKRSGPLPQHINAGNQFYGQDLAQFFCQKLPQWPLDYLDEDWGWLVFTTRDALPQDECHEICIYPEGEPSAHGAMWKLILMSKQQVPYLWVFKHWVSTTYHTPLAQELIHVLQDSGVNNLNTKTI